MHLAVETYTDCRLAQRDRTLYRSLPTGESLFVMADGSDMAFAHGYQRIMDLVKALFVQSLSHTTGPIRERLGQAATAVRSALERQFPSSDEFDEENYSATFIAVVVAGSQIFSAWIGSQQAKLFRSRNCVQATAPHVVVAALSAGDVALTLRYLSTFRSPPGGEVEIEGPWMLCPGDVVVIADYRLFALGTDDQIAEIVSDAPTSAAKSLVEWAEGIQHQFARAAIIIRILES